MMHASLQCGIVPPDIPRNRLTVSMLQQELSTVLILHFSVARCAVSIMANTSLVSETLFTKPAILSDYKHHHQASLWKSLLLNMPT